MSRHEKRLSSNSLIYCFTWECTLCDEVHTSCVLTSLHHHIIASHHGSASIWFFFSAKLGCRFKRNQVISIASNQNCIAVIHLWKSIWKATFDHHEWWGGAHTHKRALEIIAVYCHHTSNRWFTCSCSLFTRFTVIELLILSFEWMKHTSNWNNREEKIHFCYSIKFSFSSQFSRSAHKLHSDPSSAPPTILNAAQQMTNENPVSDIWCDNNNNCAIKSFYTELRIPYKPSFYAIRKWVAMAKTVHSPVLMPYIAYEMLGNHASTNK